MNLVDIIKKFLSGTPKNDDLTPDMPERPRYKLDDLLAQCDPSPLGDPSYGPDGNGGSEPMKPPAPIPWGDLVKQAKETANAASQPRPKTTHARSRKQPQTRQKDGNTRKGR